MSGWSRRKRERSASRSPSPDPFAEMASDTSEEAPEEADSDTRITAATLARQQRTALLATSSDAKTRRLITKGLASEEAAASRTAELLAEAKAQAKAQAILENPDANPDEDDGNVKTLLDQAEALREQQAELNEEQLEEANQLTAEERLLKEANTVSSNALTNARDEASGLTYTESMKTSWTAPKAIMALGEDAQQAVRDKWHILVEGDAIPPPIRSFRAMKLPQPLLDALKKKNINRPTPIQMQGLPVALSGRDMVGVAFTGSGKTVSFSIPLCMLALEEETKMPLVGGEGPIGVILAPSRELARQTYDVLCGFADAISSTGKYPQLRMQLLIGGEDKRVQMEAHDSKGIHGVVATPGRLKDLLKQKRMNFDICRFICLDEADRMLDMGFDEEVSSEWGRVETSEPRMSEWRQASYASTLVSITRYERQPLIPSLAAHFSRDLFPSHQASLAL